MTSPIKGDADIIIFCHYKICPEDSAYIIVKPKLILNAKSPIYLDRIATLSLDKHEKILPSGEIEIGAPWIGLYTTITKNWAEDEESDTCILI